MGRAKKQVDHADEVRRLTTLLDVSHALSNALDLQAGLHRVLEALEAHHGAVRGTVALLDEQTGESQVLAAIGVSARRRSAHYGPGEGITGRVVQSGRPVIVPRVSQEPLFLGRTGPRPSAEDSSFVCVPVVLGRKAVGALGVFLDYDETRDLDAATRFFRVVASMIGQAVKVHRLILSERQRLVDENTHLRRELEQRYDFSNLIGTSSPMRQTYEQVAQVAGSSTTVLIRGESGTGKELIAHAIHYNSPRARKPFIKVNCAALPEGLIEAELFGHEKGAFTGAVARKKGRFELAEGGTLFLDEIGELSLATQVKLLRVLQQRELERVGGTETVRVNVRLIAATHKNLEAAIEEKTFREDLFYRLNVFSLYVPPLRDRRTDIMLLAEHFVGLYARAHDKNIKRISTPAIDMMMSYHWPGNVRELENAVERAVLVCDGNVIHGHHLPPTLQTAEATGTVMSMPLADAVAKYEEDLILDALKTSRGNVARAARLLGSTERIVGYKIKNYGLDPKRFRA